MADREPRCTGTKTCSKCGEEKHVLAFAGHHTTADRLQSACRDCMAARDSKHGGRAVAYSLEGC